MLLFLGSLEHGSPILEAGTSLQPEHQLALQDILKIVQNKPEPLMGLDPASPARESSPSSTKVTTPPNADAVNPQMARMASAAVASSPLLTQLLESPFTSSKKQSVFVQLRRLQVEVLNLQDERDNLREDKEKETSEMSDEISKLTVQLMELQSLLSTYCTQDAYAALEQDLERVTKHNQGLEDKVADYLEMQERVTLLAKVTDSDESEIQKLQDQTAVLRSQLEESNLQSDKYKEELESLAARFSSGQEELADARASLAKREDEVLYLEQIVASHHSKPSTPNVDTEENLGEVLLNIAQDRVNTLEEKLASLLKDHDIETQNMQATLESLNLEHMATLQANERLQAECSGLKEKAVMQTLTITEKSSAAEVLAQKYLDAKNKISSLCDERDALEQSCHCLTGELEILRQNKDEAAEHYQKNVGELKAIISGLYQQHDDLSEQLSHEKANSKTLQEHLAKESTEASKKMLEMEIYASNCQQKLMEDLKEAKINLEKNGTLQIQLADQAALLEAKFAENDVLKSDLQSSVKQLSDLQSRYDTLEAVFNSTTQMLVDSSLMQSDMAQQLASLESSNLALRESVDEKISKIGQITSEMYGSQEVLQKLQSDLESKCKQHSVEIQNLEIALKQKFDEESVLQVQLADQEALLNANCTERKALQVDLLSHCTELDNLQTKYDTLEKALASTTQLLLDSDSKQNDSTQQVKHLENQNLTLHCSIDEKVSEINQLAQDLSASHKVLQEMQAAMKTDNELHCTERRNLQLALEETCAKESALHLQFADVNVRLDTKCAELKDVQSDLLLHRNKLSNLQTDYDILEEKLKCTTQLLVDSKSTQSAITQQVQHLGTQNLSLQCTIDKKMSEINQLTSDLGASHKMLQELRSAKEKDDEQHCTERQSFHSVLDEKCAHERALQLQVTEVNDHLQAKCADLEAVQSDLLLSINQLSSLQSRYDMLEAVLGSTTKMLVDNQLTQSDIAEEEKNLKSQNLTLQCSIAQKVSEVKQLDADICACRKLLQELQSAKEMSDEQHSTERHNLQVALEEKCANERALHLQLTDKDAHLKAEYTEHERVQTDLRLQANQLKDLQSKYNLVEAELESTTKMLVDSKLTQSDIAEEEKNLRSQNLILQCSIAQKVSEVKQLDADLCACRKLLQELQSAKEMSDEQHSTERHNLQAALEEKCVNEKALHLQLTDKDAHLKAECTEHEKVQTDLRLQVNQLKDLQSRYNLVETVLGSTTKMLVDSNLTQSHFAQQVKNLETENLSLLGSIDEKVSSLNQLGSDLSASRCMIQEMQATMEADHKRYSEQNHNLQKLLQEKCAQEEALRIHLLDQEVTMKSTSTQNETLQSSLSLSTTQLHNLQVHHDSLHSVLESTTQMLIDSNIAQKDLTEQLNNFYTKFSSTDYLPNNHQTCPANGVNDTLNHLFNFIESLQQSYSSAKTKLQDREKALVSNKETIMKLEMDIQDLKQQLDLLNQKLDEITCLHRFSEEKLSHENATLKECCQEKDISIKHGVCEIESLQSSVQALSGSLKKLERERENITQAKSVAENANKLLTAEISSLNIALREAYDELEDHKKKSEDLTMHVSDQIETIAELELSISNLRSEICMKTEKVTTLDQELAQSKYNCEILQNEKDAIKQELLLQTHAIQTAELSHLKEQLENEKRLVETAEAQLLASVKEHQVSVNKLENEKSTLVTASADLEKQVNSLTQNNQMLETKLATFNEITEFLDRYKVGYKEKKRIIEELKHELKLSKAQCAKYKGDFEFYKGKFEASCVPTVMDETKLTMEDLESTAIGQVESHRRRSQLPDSTRVEILGDDEGDLLIESTLKPREGSAFAEATFGILGDAAAKEEDANARIAEMKRRNTQYLPHMRSAYPIESQTYTPSKAKSDEIREAKESLPPKATKRRSAGQFLSKMKENKAKELVLIRGWAQATTQMPPKVQRASIVRLQTADPVHQSQKVLSATENIQSSDASAPIQIRPAEAFNITNTPKDSKRKSLRAKLKGALSATKR
ncbi:putative leucine-rich repeat-containing protein DDB_G0290503 [Watersipora subatra]|uniref:putative leucine-rich repeat-containing protein DDB_G0290503 n=1 Tax=Watersipora subatra TaxID=2589382 RepID=UPI00355C4C3C